MKPMVSADTSDAPGRAAHSSRSAPTEIELPLRLQALQRRGRRWLRGFLALAFASWAAGIWVVFAEPFSAWWLLTLVVPLVATGAVAVREVTGLAGTFRREVLGPLYAQAFPGARHEPDDGLDGEALQRSGLFPRLFGTQRLEQCDRLVLDHQGVPLVLCEAGVWIVGDKQTHQPDEEVFSGTLFELQARLPLAEPVVLLCGQTPAQPLPPALELDRVRRVKPGHPALDERIEVICNGPSDARAALPLPVVEALARFVSQHPGRWRVVADAQGLVGGLEGRRLTACLHPRAPLPGTDATLAQVQSLRTAKALVAALTEGRPLVPRRSVGDGGSAV